MASGQPSENSLTVSLLIILFAQNGYSFNSNSNNSSNNNKTKQSKKPKKINTHYVVDRMHNVILSRGISDVLSVCGLYSNKATIEVPCPIKKKLARVKVRYKRLVILYTRPFSTNAIIARRTFLLSSVQSYCSFPPPPRSPSRRLTKSPM